MIRYVTELRALDPYAQLRETEFIIEHGLPAFFSYRDYMSWYPFGINLGSYLYLGLAFTGAFFYYLFQFLGFNISIHDVCAMVPAIMGAITCIVMYFLGKELAGNKKTGLLAAFFLALCVGFQSRTISGFYDNEATGLFGMLLFFYFFIKGLKTGSIPWSILSGCALSILAASWGSFTYIYDLLPLTVLFLVLLKRYSSRLLLVYSITFFMSMVTNVLVPHTGWREIISGEAMINYGLIGLLFLFEIYRRFKETAAYGYVRTNWKMILRVSLFGILILLIVTSITGSLQTFIGELVRGQIIQLTGGRFLEAILPWVAGLTVQSVAEHMPASWGLFYYNFEFLLFLFPLGLYFLFKRLYEEDVLIIVFGLTSVYFASSMSRLQMIFALSLPLIGAFGLASLIKPFSLVLRKKFVTVRRRKRLVSIVTREVSVAIFALMFFLLLFTSIHGTYTAAYQMAQPGMSNDDRETYAWMRANFNSGTVIASWWDYGYQITMVGNCTSIIDNGTINVTAMGMMGRMFMADDELESIDILKSWHADYVYVEWSYFYPNGGGDEGKWQWMIRIAFEQLVGTPFWIQIGDRWNESTYKPTCEFFNTTLWKMLTYGEPFIDSEALIEALLNKGYPLGYFEARLNWADPWVPGSRAESGQWKDDGGHLWKYHNPPIGKGMLDDGVVDYTGDGVDDTVGQFANLNYFIPIYFSSGHLVKVFGIDYDKAKLRAQITGDSHLFNDSTAQLSVKNIGEKIFNINSVSINGISVNFVPLSGTATTGIIPGAVCQIKAYGSNLPVGQIKNGSSYPVEVTVSDGTSVTYTALNKLIAESDPLTNMTINSSQIQALSNQTILVPITNTGANSLEIASVQLNNQSVTNFGMYHSSLGEKEVNINCNFTVNGFSLTNITATEGDVINFHVTNLVPDSTIKFGISEFNKEAIINYGQTQILSVGATQNGTFPFYCYNILWPPDTYSVGNLTILDSIIKESWDYKFIPINQTQFLYIYPTPQLIPNQLINLTISSTPNDNITRKFANLQVFSPTSCLTVLNSTAFANETVSFKVKNTGAYNEIIDHIWLNGQIFDIFSTPNAHGVSLTRNQTQIFVLKFAPSVYNLNITSPYDPRPLQLNISLINSHTMDSKSLHAPSLQVINDYKAYNISISDEIFSNETVFLNIKNKGSKSITISDIWINNITTTHFLTTGSPVITPGATKLFNISSNLNLNYLDSAQIMARSFEGPYASLNRTVKVSGKINITWSESYQNNQTIFLKVANLKGTPVTIKDIFINSIKALRFIPIDASFHPLSNSYNTIPGNSNQLFNVTISYTQFTTLDRTRPLLVNLTTYEGVFVLHNVTWAYAMSINKVYAFTNKTVTVYLKNIGRYPITVNRISLNSTSNPYTLINGSLSLAPGTTSIFKLTSNIQLKFGNRLNVEAIANYTRTLKNITSTYNVAFVLYNGPNITITSGWPGTVAFDNGSSPYHDTVYLTVMNTGNLTIKLTNFLLFNGTIYLPHQFKTINNQSLMILEPDQSITYVNRSILFEISANRAQFLKINLTTNIRLDALHNMSVITSLRVLHNYPNITIWNQNATVAYYYSSPPPPRIVVQLNLTNYGNTLLTINLPNDVTINITGSYEWDTVGSIILKPGESIIRYATKTNPAPVAQYLRITVTAWYGSNSVTDQLIIQVYPK